MKQCNTTALKIRSGFLTLVLLAVVLLLASPALAAYDLGLVISTVPSVESPEGFSDWGTRLSADIKPWFSTSWGAGVELYVSPGLSIKYNGLNYNSAPELYRAELSFRLPQRQTLKVGRIPYADPLGFIARGFFDGAAYERSGRGDFSFGAYYTGLLYKKTAVITVSQEELDSYRGPLDYDDFAGTYFAPSRALIQTGYSGLWGENLRYHLALLSQIDLNGRREYYSAEYLTGKIVLPYKNLFLLETGGAVQIIQTSGRDTQLGLAGELSFSWMPPGALQDRLLLTARYASGRFGNSVLAEFRPLTSEPQGRVLRAKLSGLTIVETGYTARLMETLSLDLRAAYLFQNDRASYQGTFASTTDYFLGGEVFAQLVFSPLSDLQFNLGGGMFFPGLGNTQPDAKPLGLVSLNIILAVL
jgi:hypothetical protein